jgi:hypothetical protein
MRYEKALAWCGPRAPEPQRHLISAVILRRKIPA